jgi:hypothetical protein
MDPVPILLARNASARTLIGARPDDPVVPDSPGLLTRVRRALPRGRRRRQNPARAAAVETPLQSTG